MLRLVALLCCIALSYAIQHPLVAEQIHQDDYQAEQARELLKHILGSSADGGELKAGQLGFSWSNCGKDTDTIHVSSMSLSPDPIVIPGSVNVSIEASIAKDIISPTALVLKVKKKLFGVFIDVPCVDNVGSCTYQNPCNLLSNFTCPEVFKEHGFDCRCPIKKNKYILPASLIKIPDIKLPSFIENGDYEIRATLNQGSTRLGCYDIKASLKAKSSLNV